MKWWVSVLQASTAAAYVPAPLLLPADTDPFAYGPFPVLMGLSTFRRGRIKGRCLRPGSTPGDTTVVKIVGKVAAQTVFDGMAVT